MVTRTRTAAMVAAAAMLATAHAAAAAESAVAAVDVHADHGQVRSGSPVIALAMRQAMERSETFRGLVATIEASDTYVYVNEGDCGHGVRACFVTVTSSGSHRFMFVWVDSRKADSELMGSIGHELRHTIEVIGNPSVKSDAAKYFFYRRIGTHGTTRAYETIAAVDAGNAVRAEVHKFNQQAKSD
jgi:hypothetical protein